MFRVDNGVVGNQGFGLCDVVDLLNEMTFKILLRRVDFNVIYFITNIHENQVKRLRHALVDVFVCITDFGLEDVVWVETEVVSCDFNHLGVVVD